MGERYAREQGISYQSFPADWNKYGKAAGAIRNSQMLKEGRPDLVLVFLHNIAVQENRGSMRTVLKEEQEETSIPIHYKGKNLILNIYENEGGGITYYLMEKKE